MCARPGADSCHGDQSSVPRWRRPSRHQRAVDRACRPDGDAGRAVLPPGDRRGAGVCHREVTVAGWPDAEGHRRRPIVGVRSSHRRDHPTGDSRRGGSRPVLRPLSAADGVDGNHLATVRRGDMGDGLDFRTRAHTDTSDRPAVHGACRVVGPAAHQRSVANPRAFVQPLPRRGRRTHDSSGLRPSACAMPGSGVRDAGLSPNHHGRAAALVPLVLRSRIVRQPLGGHRGRPDRAAPHRRKHRLGGRAHRPAARPRGLSAPADPRRELSRRRGGPIGDVEDPGHPR